MTRVKYDNVVISGVAYWAKLIQPNHGTEMYPIDPPKWTADFLIDNEESLNKLKSVGGVGVNIKEGKYDHPYIAVNKPTQWPSGDAQDPPEIIDNQKNPWDGRLIGNGSKIKAIVKPYQHRNGIGVELVKLQVVDHVPYGDPEDDPFEVVSDEELAVL